MSITGGFGFTFDSGFLRRWYMGRDGIRRWVDNDAPVEPSQPSKKDTTHGE